VWLYDVIRKQDITVRLKCRLQIFQDKVIRKIFGLKRYVVRNGNNYIIGAFVVYAVKLFLE
jgi:hypothetical protein